MAEVTPSSPAPVSGPGALSKRTDGGPAQKLRDLPDAQYGEATTFRDLQKSAPLAQTPGPGQGSPSSGSATGQTPSVIPFDAPTTRPNEPVTAGSQFGPGPGPEALGPAANAGAASYNSTKNTLASVAQASGNPEAIALLKMLQTRM